MSPEQAESAAIVYDQKAIRQQEKAWIQYVLQGGPEPSSVRPIVLESWKRCREQGFDPLQPPSASRLPDSELKRLRTESTFLRSVAMPYLKMLYRLTDSAKTNLALADARGVILEALNHQDTLEAVEQIKHLPGFIKNEENAGTTALGLALRLAQPVQVVGPEYYNQFYHFWACSSAPIVWNSNVYGAVSAATHFTSAHPHSLGLVASVAEAIAKEIRHRLEDRGGEENGDPEKEGDLNRDLLLEAGLEAAGLDFLVVDRFGLVRKVGPMLARRLSVNPDGLTGQPVDSMIVPEPFLAQLLVSGREYVEREVSFKSGGNRHSLVSSGRPVKAPSGQNVGALIVFHRGSPAKRGGSPAETSLCARYSFTSLVGRSACLSSVLSLARRAAAVDCTVLLVGESGTGKELLAHAIHNASSRSRGPFVPLNCAALPRELAESELFGYDGGAFTGARREGKPGKFEQASGGTIFLDEIGDLALDLQGKLLRILEEKRVVRVGGTRPVALDGRVIAATNKDLRVEVREKRFREDLYYRLDLLRIEVPPLRQRLEDVGPLADRFLITFQQEYGLPSRSLSPGALAILKEQRWPGNVRELQNILARVSLCGDSNQIEADDILDAVHGPCRMTAPSRVDTLAEVERAMILKALEATGWNRLKAAKALGIGRNTLYRKLREYGLAESGPEGRGGDSGEDEDDRR